MSEKWDGNTIRHIQIKEYVQLFYLGFVYNKSWSVWTATVTDLGSFNQTNLYSSTAGGGHLLDYRKIL